MRPNSVALSLLRRHVWPACQDCGSRAEARNLNQGLGSGRLRSSGITATGNRWPATQPEWQVLIAAHRRSAGIFCLCRSPKTPSAHPIQGVKRIYRLCYPLLRPLVSNRSVSFDIGCVQYPMEHSSIPKEYRHANHRMPNKILIPTGLWHEALDSARRGCASPQTVLHRLDIR